MLRHRQTELSIFAKFGTNHSVLIHSVPYQNSSAGVVSRLLADVRKIAGLSPARIRPFSLLANTHIVHVAYST